MTHETVSPLTLELLDWISTRRRTYAEAMDAWRSNCPRHAVWDDAVIDRLVQVVRDGGSPNDARVTLTELGQALLAQMRGRTGLAGG